MNLNFKFNIPIILSVLYNKLLSTVGAVSVEKDLTISESEKRILEQFREQVLPQLPHDYMKTDIYLIRWLRARNFDLTNAQTMLLDNLKWRKENNMDTIREEDWSYFEKNYKCYTDIADKTGRPTGILNLVSWDIRWAMLMGQGDKINRYLDRTLEILTVRVREAEDQGLNVTQFKYIVDLGGINLIQQGCFQCIQVHIHYITSYEKYFPGSSDGTITVNMPRVFEEIFSVVRPFISPDSRDGLQVFGADRRQWEPYLLSEFDPDQLPEEIGGTKYID